MSMNHLMLDLETMGKNPNAPIVAIGAVMFDPVAGELGETFYRQVDLEDAVRTGGVMDASTVLWWLQQDEAARAAVVVGGECVAAALVALSDFVSRFNQQEPVNIWGNGATFDNVVIGTAFERMALQKPWGYSRDRCFRTLKNLCPVDAIEFEGVPHHALHDAVHQAKHALAIAKAYPNLNWS